MLTLNTTKLKGFLLAYFIRCHALKILFPEPALREYSMDNESKILKATEKYNNLITIGPF